MNGSQTLQKIFYTSKGFLKQQSPTILTCIGAVGVVGTSVLTAKATVKATKLLEKAEDEKGEFLTKKEKIKIAGPSYIPAALLGASTISCMFGADFLNKRKQAALVGAYTVLDRSYKEYKEKITELYGEETDAKIKDSIAKDKYESVKYKIKKPIEEQNNADVLLFFDEYSNRYFWRTMDDVKNAQYHLNRNFVLRGYADLNEFYSFLGLEPTAYGAEVGWSMEAGGAFYGYTWVDFYIDRHEPDTINEPAFYTIRMPFGPTADYLDY